MDSVKADQMSEPYPDQDRSEVAGAGWQSALYREVCREPGCPAPLDARILAMARLQAESNAREALRKKRRKMHWVYGFSVLGLGACTVLALLVVPAISPVVPARTPALQPASLVALPMPAKPLPEIRMPTQAPASTQVNDPCRVRVDVATARAAELLGERERLSAQGCDASLARVDAQMAAGGRKGGTSD